MRAKLREQRAGFLFVLPALLLFGIFVAYPIIYNVQASTMNWDGVNEGTFIGLDNYFRLFKDPIFLTTLKNSAWWIPLTIIPQALIGFFLAYMLNTALKGRTIYRAIFFIPAILSPVVVGIAWQRILDPFNGILAKAAKAVGLDFLAHGYLSDPDTAIFAAIFVNIWMWTGFSMLFYLAGLQTIDDSVLEAARIDGASGWKMITRILLPLLKPTHLSLMLLGVIGSLKTFELVYMLTEGGPNHASEMLPTYTFKQAFQLQSVGYGAAISVVLLIIAVGSSLWMIRAFGSGFMTGDDKK